MFDDPYRTADAGTLPYDPQPLPRAAISDVLAVVGGTSTADSNGQDAQDWLKRMEDAGFFSDMTQHNQALMLELIENARGVRYQTLRNELIEVIEEAMEEQP